MAENKQNMRTGLGSFGLFGKRQSTPTVTPDSQRLSFSEALEHEAFSSIVKAAESGSFEMFMAAYNNVKKDYSRETALSVLAAVNAIVQDTVCQGSQVTEQLDRNTRFGAIIKVNQNKELDSFAPHFRTKPRFSEVIDALTKTTKLSAHTGFVNSRSAST